MNPSHYQLLGARRRKREKDATLLLGGAPVATLQVRAAVEEKAGIETAAQPVWAVS